jgi:hypothetical protein
MSLPCGRLPEQFQPFFSDFYGMAVNYFQMLGLPTNYLDVIPAEYLKTYPLNYLESLSPELQRKLVPRLPAHKAELFPYKPLPPAQPGRGSGNGKKD